jgi:hypothetical protein
MAGYLKVVSTKQATELAFARWAVAACPRIWPSVGMGPKARRGVYDLISVGDHPCGGLAHRPAGPGARGWGAGLK